MIFNIKPTATSEPPECVTGSIYFDFNTSRRYIFDGNSWLNIFDGDVNETIKPVYGNGYNDIKAYNYAMESL